MSLTFETQQKQKENIFKMIEEPLEIIIEP